MSSQSSQVPAWHDQPLFCGVALSSIGDGVILTDAAGLVTFMNPVAEELSGWKTDEAVGRPLDEVFAIVNEATRQPVDNPVIAALRDNEVVGLANHTMLIRRDGHETPIDDSAAPILDESGQLVGAVLVFRDFSEKRRAAETNERLAAIIDSSDDIIASKDLNGIITSWNKGAERILGYTADEVVGKHVSMLMPEDHLDDTVKILGQIRQGLRVDHYETKRRARDGRIVDVSLTVSPIRDAHGRVVGASKVGRDITELRRAREVRERLAAIVESSDDIIVSKDLNGFITSWNRGAERVLGYRATEVVGKHISMLMPDGHVDDFARILERISRGESIEHFETQRRRKDGKIIDVSLTVSPLRDASGKIIGASKIGRDITEKKRTEQLLLQREGELQTLADTIPQLAWMANPDGHIFWYNRRWYEYTGKSFEELQGWGWQSIHDPEILPQVNERWNESLRTGEPFEMEFPLRGAYGQYRWFLTRVIPLRDDNGRILRWFGTNTDVSEQRLQELALKASEARLRALVEASPECVKIVAPDGSLEFMNHAGVCMIEGESEAAVHGANVIDVIAPEHRQHWIHQHQKVCAGARLNWDFEIVGLKGGRRWMETHAVPLPLSEGRVGQLAVTRDISGRKQAELEREELLNSERAARAEAERANRMKDEFVATLSHELRTPLNAILGWSQVLEMGTRDPEELEEGLTAIARNARMQTQLVDDLLDMSRIMTGKLRLDVQQINPTSFVEDAIESVLPALHAKGIRLEQVLSNHISVISGDPHRLQQVIWNLLNNAVKFTPKGGKIQVTTSRVNSHVEISVSDTGCGIKPEFLPFVFDRFRQADSSTTRLHGGLGLGLALVRQLTEMHGGTVGVNSPGEGQGATFTIRLPLSLARVHAEEPDTEPASYGPIDDDRVDLSGIKVLVVDDEPDSCEIARRILESCRAEVVTASSADEALGILQRVRPNAVISDIGMPGKDGYQFIRAVRALTPAEGGRTPAAALTAFARSEDRRRALMAGYHSHVVKPVEPMELVTVVASLVGRTGMGK